METDETGQPVFILNLLKGVCHQSESILTLRGGMNTGRFELAMESTSTQRLVQN
jgi:hypothetical protein